MDLAAATHFSQGWSPAIAGPAREIGVAIVRDSLHWEEIERRPGEYRFEGPRSLHPQWLAARGIEARLVFARGNPLYDDGHTPYTPEGRRAFAEFVAAALLRFPQVRVIEIGNEFNAQNFVAGPVRDRPYAERAGLYTALLCAVAERIRPEFPDVTILGGAAHSVPVEYLRATFEAGALDCSDGIAVHPYTSPPEHLASHLALLRAAMGDVQQPIHATEFGRDSPDVEGTADYLIKMVAVMAADGVESATWYALREQRWNKGMELLATTGATRPAGEAFALAQRLLAFGPVRRIESDAFTYLYLFGDRALVAWGAPRSIELAVPATWLDAQGAPASTPLTLDEETPVIAIVEKGEINKADLRLGTQTRIADSFHQFDVTNSGGTPGTWAYFERSGDGVDARLETMGGGERQNEGWRPYLGGSWRRPLSVSETRVTPVQFGNKGNPKERYDIVETFHFENGFSGWLCGLWSISSSSESNVTISVAVDLFEVAQLSVHRDVPASLEFPLSVSPGGLLAISTVRQVPSPGSTPIDRRIMAIHETIIPPPSQTLCRKLSTD